MQGNRELKKFSQENDHLINHENTITKRHLDPNYWKIRHVQRFYQTILSKQSQIPFRGESLAHSLSDVVVDLLLMTMRLRNLIGIVN